MKAANVRLVQLDLQKHETLEAALKGVEKVTSARDGLLTYNILIFILFYIKVLLIQTNQPDSSIEGKQIVDAAKQAGVKHIVKVVQ